MKSLSSKKILIVGHGRHGKDTVAEILRDVLEFTFKASSEACCELFIFEALRVKYGYNTPAECFDDRLNHRKEWFDLIVEFNATDLTRLAKEIFKENDIYVGLRNVNELNAIKANIEDVHVVWVDASERLPPEPVESMTITKEDADSVIDNNGLEKYLEQVVMTWFVWVL